VLTKGQATGANRTDHRVPTPPLEISIITTPSEFASLRDGWNALLAESGSDLILLTWEWVSTWWQTFGDGHELYVMVLKDPLSGEGMGIAPLMRKRMLIGALPLLSRLKFIGEGEPVCSDYMDFIFRRHPVRRTVREKIAPSAQTGDS
jgi:CelD/BcsL family acetyltransferase involved in cellulose biosynthesis